MAMGQIQTRHEEQTKETSKDKREKFWVIVGFVIVVAIFAFLVWPVIPPVIPNDDEFIIATEIEQLNHAVEQFNTEFGFYPPDFTAIRDAEHFNEYLLKVAPDHQEDVERWWVEIGKDLNPSNALTFWLSGLRNNREYPLSSDHDGDPATPRKPAPLFAALPSENKAIGDRKVFFEFKLQRMDKNGSYAQAKGDRLPYIYFCSSYTVDDLEKSFTEPKTGDQVRPYRKSDSAFFHPNKFQIIAPGFDGRYGEYVDADWRHHATIQLHDDNWTNFSRGSRLGLQIVD